MSEPFQFEWTLVTPEVAAEWLTRIGPQRSLRMTRVSRYAGDMTQGRWGEDIMPIVFDVDGHLVNGQHRLQAVVMSGTTQRFSVMTGASRDAIKYMDTGLIRQTGDRLKLEGISNHNAVAAIARSVLRSQQFPNTVWNTQSDVSDAAVVEEVLADVELYEAAVAFGGRLRQALGQGWLTNPAGALHILVSRASSRQELWPAFEHGLLSGAGLAEDDARLALRAFAIRPDMKPWGRTQSRLIAFIRGWNNYVDDVPTKLLKNPRRDELPIKAVR